MKEFEACLVLQYLSGIGWQRRQKLLMHFGSAIAIFKASAKEWQTVPGLGEYACKGLATWEKVYPKAKQQRKHLEKYQVEYLKFGTEDYPLPLSYCSDAPILLYFKAPPNLKIAKSSVS